MLGLHKAEDPRADESTMNRQKVRRQMQSKDKAQNRRRPLLRARKRKRKSKRTTDKIEGQKVQALADTVKYPWLRIIRRTAVNRADNLNAGLT
jgi:hypothetical protein